MKGRITILTIFLLFTLSVQAAPEITASVLRYEPTPAEQGNTIDVWIQLNNAGTKAERVSIEFVPEYPFSLPEGQIGRIDIGELAATETKVVKFAVFVDSSAPNGDRDITFQYKFASEASWAQFESPITIETQDAGIVIEDYNVNPSPAIPGQIIELNMKLRNTGRIAVKNVDVSIELEDGKFSTVESGAKKRIELIPAGSSANMVFKLASDTSTEVKVYSIPLRLSFQDERNKRYTETAKVSVIVNAEPELALTVDSTRFESKKKPGTVSLKIVNKGVMNLKYVTVRLVKTPDYEILSSSNEEYVGNLDSDDFETVDFVVEPLVKNPRLAVQLEFKDSYNKDYSQRYELPLRIITASDLGEDKNYLPIIIILLIAAAGAAYWKFWRKRK